MKRITVFLGAGAAIEIGGPTTAELTKVVRNKKQTHFNKERTLIDQIAKVLDDHGDYQCNFEEIFHTLELINSYRTGWRGAVRDFTPYLVPFVKARLTRFFKDDLYLLIAKQDIIQTVAEVVSQYDSNYKSLKNSWNWNFWKDLETTLRLDIATLNYDTSIEQSISSLEDGFESTKFKFERFNAIKLVNSESSKLFHLHGCINYGYSRTENPNEYTLWDDFHDLYKYSNFKEASETWFGRSSHFSQASEEAHIGAILTGLRKTEKVVSYPYSLYYSLFHQAIINNSSLLIVGYSFGDLHFNRMLDRVVSTHGDDRRIVIITKFAGPVWHRDWTVMDWPENRDMMVFASKAFQDYEPFATTSAFKTPKSPLISKDGCARMYLNGLKEAVENHSQDIINFLSGS